MLPACFNSSAYVLLECSFVRPCRSTSEEAIVTNAGLNLERTEVFPGRFFPGVVLLGTVSGKRVRVSAADRILQQCHLFRVLLHHC